jgi:nucleotide-binding universal stress UspA family protein
MLKRILVPLDGSALSARILVHVRRLLVREDVEVTVLGVVHDADDEREQLQRHLEQKCSELRLRKARAEALVVAGDPATMILEVARSTRASLIALATHGRSGLARVVRGSVAEQVLRRAPVPVLAANPKALGETQELRFARILLPLDGSELAAEVIPLAAQLALIYGSEILLHYNVELPPPSDAVGPRDPAPTEEDAHALLARFQPRLECASTRRIVTTGVTASAILDTAAAEAADLIAMTTHGRTGASRLLLGSTAERVLRDATCPLLVKRTISA